MLKRTLLLLLLLPVIAISQVLDPVKWSTELKDLGNNEYEIYLYAKIDKGWHIYSQQHPDGGIGVPASITFENNANIQLIGKTRESGKLMDRYSEMFKQQEKLYENKVTFIQKIKLKEPKETTVKFSSESQVCDAEKCLPPDWRDYSIKISPKAIVSNKEEAGTKAEEPIISNTENSNVQQVEQPVEAEQTGLTHSESKDSTTVATAPVITSNDDLGSDGANRSKSLWEIFLAGVAGGLIALIMPCIFPMIPLTVSLFTKQKNQSKAQGIKKAMIYGLSIVFIFVFLASIITWAFGPSTLNEFSTNPWVNIAFFVIFVFFAISFFGAFELTLPASWANYTDKKADKGGYIGIFFMAFTLVIISFSCTLPIIGTLATQAAMSGAYYGLIIGSLGFSVTLAIPFVLFAIFPSWVSTLPKSGGWMNTVKVCLGFIELAFAFKFLSNADLVWQAQILGREAFLAIWIAIFGLMGVYLLGRFRMPLDSEQKHISTGRLFFAIITFSFVVYMIPGMWGAPVKLLAGFTPPVHYAESPNGFGGSTTIVSSANGNNEETLVKGQKYGPHQIPIFLDLDDALAYSKTVNKPVMIDFTGYACANCRKVEERVWSDPNVKELLMNDVVLVSLYVDERTELPKEEQVFSETLGRQLKTIGNKWTAFQIEKYKNNAQPYYILVDEDLNNYNKNIGAILDVNEYLNWMKTGIENYTKAKKMAKN